MEEKMNDEKKSVEPWQLILILVLLLAFFGGLYVTNQSISAKLDAIEASVNATKDILKLTIDKVDNRVESLQKKMNARAAAAAPVPAPAPAPVPAPAPAGDTPSE